MAVWAGTAAVRREQWLELAYAVVGGSASTTC